jgi:exodeoxyribonuclease VII small subunit
MVTLMVEDPRTFEELMSALEDVTSRLAAGDLGIEAAVDLYEEAQQLHALASERLAQVQARVEALAAPDQPALDRPADRPPLDRAGVDRPAPESRSG